MTVNSFEQSLEEQVSGYFRVYDTAGVDSGYYTTVSISDMTGINGTIGANNIFMKGSGVQLITGTANPRVVIATGFASYQPLS